MSNFTVQVYEVKIEEHPNADAIELAVIGAYRSIVRKGQFKNGDLVAYIPEASLIPKNILEELGLVDKLSGPGGNKVKAIKLRGVVSQGLVYPAKSHWNIGDDVKEELGIVKWEPEIPVALRGNYMNAGQHRTMKYDIENYKKFPNLFQDGEEVVFCEKLHGTFCCIGVMPDTVFWCDELPEDTRLTVSSKGLGAQGLSFRHKHPDNINNVYCRIANMLEKQLVDTIGDNSEPIFILGEIYGNGVQDLSYGCSAGEIKFRAFDVFVGSRNNGIFLSDSNLDSFLKSCKIDRVPVLYRGPFSHDAVERYTNGKETVSGKSACIREGIVIRPVIERTVTFENNPCKFDGVFGRVQLKSVSNDYLLRKGNVTEYS